MAPSLIVATAIFAAFLVVLALIAFAAYRFAARKEGPGLGAAGGCALAAVLLGAAFFALIGFVILVGVLVARRAAQSGEFDRWRDTIHHELDRVHEYHDVQRTPVAEDDSEPHSADVTDDPDDKREY